MDEQAKQTPLVELLDAVPEDVRIGTQDGADWHAGTTWHPVGRLCHEAAAELRRLHAVNQELRNALHSISLAAQEREKVAAWMRNCGYATGHGDAIEDLLDHLGTQIAEGLKVEVLMEREACADICDQHASIEGVAQRCAAAIRARGNK